jgi:hypothetical protein
MQLISVSFFPYQRLTCSQPAVPISCRSSAKHIETSKAFDCLGWPHEAHPPNHAIGSWRGANAGCCSPAISHRGAESGCSHALELDASVGGRLAKNDGWRTPEMPLPSSDSSMTGIPILRTKSQSIGQACDVATLIFFPPSTRCPTTGLHFGAARLNDALGLR